MHLQSIELLRPTVWEKHGAFTRKYIICHRKCCPVPSTFCELCNCKVWNTMSNGLVGDAFTRKYIIWPLTLHWGQGHTKCCPVPSTSCDVCTCKVWSCYVQRFRRRCIYNKDTLFDFWPWPWGRIKCCPAPSTLCELFTCKLWSY